MKTVRKSAYNFIFFAALASSQGLYAQEQESPASDQDKSAEFSPERIAQGKQMYKQLCLRCHGPDMNGGNNAFDLRTFPLDQRDRFFHSVTNGKRQMPPWKGTLTDEDIGILWAYVGSRGGKLQR